MEISEDEQVEALKKWWKENGTAVIVGIVIGISVVVGVWQYREYTETQAIEASNVYIQFTEALAKQDAEQVKQEFDELQKEYKGTSYAMLAALHMARQAVEKKQYPQAEQHLRWAVNNSGHESLAHVARIRLADLLVAQEKYDEAMTLLDAKVDSAFAAQYQEIRGDIYSAKGQSDKAREAYAAALEMPTLFGKRRDFLQMKLSNLEASPVKETQPQTETNQ